VAASAAVLAGWLFLLSPYTPNPLVRWSCDLLQLFLPHRDRADIVLIYMDEQAMQDYGQRKPETWDRSLHARLLHRLRQDQPRLVVFDVTFTQPGLRDADDQLARAIGRNGRVVLAGDRVPTTTYGGNTVVPPLEQFETNALAWGIPKIETDPDRVGRRYDAGGDRVPDLAWAAANAVQAPVTLNPERRLKEKRWLNYYGSARPFKATSMSYSNAEAAEAGFFAGKAVFIGGQPQTLLRGEITDVFGTPFTKWNGEFIPGVDVTALAYANLLHGDWLRRPGAVKEMGLLLVTGFLCGYGLLRVRARPALWLSLWLVAVLIGGSMAAVIVFHVWFPWLVVALVQLPCAWLFRLFVESAAPAPSPETVLAPSGQLEIPDHTLIRCIGEGAYGQVWLARNAIGLFHAVKVVYRSRFGTDEPYERAWRGIQKFMPVSRSHEGFVHILHAGRNDKAGFFFYIMEAGDDQRAVQQIDPATYAPKTLAGELKQCEMLSPRHCLDLMLAMTDTVERLHQRQLVHRDIKPANLIFVSDRPKLADIDLVTDLSPQGGASFIGTEGYLAPEGPGTAAADVFSLGRLLYVALTGKSPDQCPELPTRFASRPDTDLFLALNQISCKACETDLSRRYASAAAMREDLLKVAHGLLQ
jgi:CHASE2 domain-containing sensor protein